MDLKTHEIVSEMFAFKKHLAKEVGGGREGGGGGFKSIKALELLIITQTLEKYKEKVKELWLFFLSKYYFN